ncbi:Hypothetical protein R9X50_00779800 [Acrodontium crateriforme]|uniref:Probable 26S proteasome regulatory subunit p27 n=1 Tax=Acrodontium crateriforme TaxID=150365 RepID=A0AAQ3MD86_9PEZI|nr:Hypothetical protein R9X50_00779800 [Acrodontium crateriforme]
MFLEHRSFHLPYPRKRVYFGLQMGLRMDEIHAPTVASGPTSSGSPNGTDKKLSFNELVAQKENLEAKLSALSSVLDSHGVNMNTSLTTFDGYPRADIDVAQIRTTRASIIRLKNDHKAIMANLEVVIQDHFASGKAANTPSTSSEQRSGEQANTASFTRRSPIELPFAKVNSIVPSSPAATAGLQVGDQITRFGSVNWSTPERLNKVPQIVQQNENQSILVVVLRAASANSAPQQISLNLTPRRDWGGRGLLGCHILPA